MQHRTANLSTAKPDESSLALTEEIMRSRAYRFYEERGCEHGHDLEDWTQAESEIIGGKLASPTAGQEATAGRGKPAMP